MNVLELVKQKGIDPKRVSSNKGGEYHSSCPMCGDGGKGPASDRFHIWPEQRDGHGSWWCRQCRRGGDRISLVMAMDGLSFKEACASLGVDMPDAPTVPFKPRASKMRHHSATYTPSQYQRPEDRWREHAGKFVDWAHHQLVENHPEEMDRLFERGIDPSTVVRWGLGWNQGKDGKDLFRAREAWGLETIEKEDGKKKKLWIPRGLVIPYRRDGVLERVRIRRPKVYLRSDSDPRYYVLPGSSAMPWIIGERRRAYVVIETELDGLLVDQEACHLVGVLALGSASNMPDEYCHRHLESCLVILNALDFDKAGAQAWPKWKAAYPQADRWPVPVGKDPGDAYKGGVDIMAWVLAGLPPAWRIGLSPFEAKGLQGAAVESRPKDTGEQDAPAPEASRGREEIAPTVRELGDMLRRYPLRVHNSAKRTGYEAPSSFRNDDVCRRISQLIYEDPDCTGYLMRHPAEIITGRNFYHG